MSSISFPARYKQICCIFSSLHLVKECVIDKRVGFGLSKHSRFTEKFSNVIQSLQEAGLIQKWIGDEMDKIHGGGGATTTSSSSTSSRREIVGHLKPWTFYQLQAPLTLFLAMLVAGVICFGIELVAGRLFSFLLLVPGDPTKREPLFT